MLIAARGTSGTRRARRAAIVFGLGVGLMLSAAGSAGATGTLDQSQTTSDFIEFLVSPLSSFGVMFGQTFTDGITGNLDQVDLVLGQGFHCAADAPLHVAIETTSVGKPSNNVVASASLPSTGVPFTPDWTSVHFSPTAPVTAVPSTRLCSPAKPISARTAPPRMSGVPTTADSCRPTRVGSSRTPPMRG